MSRIYNRVSECENDSEYDRHDGFTSSLGKNVGGYESEDMFAKDSETDQSDDPDSEPEMGKEESQTRKEVEIGVKAAIQTPTVHGRSSKQAVKYSSVPARKTTPYSHLLKGNRSRSLSNTPKHVSMTCPKTLNMSSERPTGDGEGYISSVLGEITNMLGTVIERLDKTESKLHSMERQLMTPSSSAASGSDNKRIVPTVVRVRE